MQRQKQTALFNKAGYSPEESALLADLQQRSPEAFAKRIAPKNNENNEYKRQLNAEKLKGNVENFRDIRSIVQQMKAELATGKVNVGLIPSAKSKYLGPNFNNPETENYEKLANELLILTSDAAKGVQNIFRTKLRQNAKPSLQHSLQVNERILDDIDKRVGDKESTFFRMNPDLKEYFQDEQPQQQQSMGQPGGQPGSMENPTLEQDEQGNLYLNGQLLKKRGG